MAADKLLSTDDAGRIDSRRERVRTGAAQITLSGKTWSATDSDLTELSPRDHLRAIVRGLGAWVVSTLVHVVIFVVLGVLVFDEAIRAEIRTLSAEVVMEELEEPVEIELSEEIETVTQRTLDMIDSAPLGRLDVFDSSTASPVLDQRLANQAATPDLLVGAPSSNIPSTVQLIEPIPDIDVKGDPRDIIGDYQEAMDRLSEEIVLMLDRGPVLVVWLFDQSNSMKDDQQEIRDRIDNVYDQLGIVDTKNSGALWTAVTSFGGNFLVHTAKPTSDRQLISTAIDSIPIDPSGQERMCHAVGQAIRSHRRFTARGRQMALILVTDESGEADDNDRYLEAAVAEAKAAKCRVYVLGREAMFGYPYAYIHWRHRQTRQPRWLPINRGPETGFPEQLQTNGFRRRGDAFSSGFGPYEQARLARETNGVFFMLPSVEEELTGKQNRYRYDLEAMRPFLPDLRPRIEILSLREEQALRAVIWQVISDLNPFDERAQKVVELDQDFPLQFEKLIGRVRENQQKAKLLLRYMGEAQAVLESGTKLREQEANPRWQANFDLIHAQLVAYQARIYEYGVGLDAFLNNYAAERQDNPPVKGNQKLHRWHVQLRHPTLSAESRSYIERATKMLEQVAEDYRGTPWGARAEWELKRGYGVYLQGYYDIPWKKVSNPSPYPKL